MYGAGVGTYNSKTKLLTALLGRGVLLRQRRRGCCRWREAQRHCDGWRGRARWLYAAELSLSREKQQTQSEQKDHTPNTHINVNVRRGKRKRADGCERIMIIHVHKNTHTQSALLLPAGPVEPMRALLSDVQLLYKGLRRNVVFLMLFLNVCVNAITPTKRAYKAKTHSA